MTVNVWLDAGAAYIARDQADCGPGDEDLLTEDEREALADAHDSTDDTTAAPASDASVDGAALWRAEIPF